MTFFPTGPLTTGEMITAVVLAPALIARRRPDDLHLAGALVVSWFAARLATKYENWVVILVGWSICALWLGLTARTAIAKAVAFLYAVRVLAIASLPFVGWFVFWEFNRVFLWLQFLLIFSTALPIRGKNSVPKSLFVRLSKKITPASRDDHAK